MFNFGISKESAVKTVRPQLKPWNIYEVKFMGCEVREFAGKKDPSVTYKVLDVKFENDMSADIKFQLGNIGEASTVGPHKIVISDIKWEKKTRGGLAGDANNDGIVSTADLVLFSRRLLGDAVTVMKNNCDLYKDDRFDVYDLIKLREILIKGE